MQESNVDISGADRGDKTIEELEAAMPQAAIDLANANAEKVVLATKKAERKFNRRNRTAWNRMNRKSRTEKIERNMEKILNLVSFKGFLTDAQVKATEIDAVMSDPRMDDVTV